MATEHVAAPAPPGTEAPPAPPRPRRRHRLLAWVILLAVFAAAFYFILRRPNQTQQAAAGPGAGRRGAFGPVTLNAATAQKGDIGVYLNAIGTVTPVYTASITAQAGGVITAVHYREGQAVKKGDPLIDIDPRPYEAQVTQAEGALDRDTNLLAQAQMDLERYRAAWARNAIPKQTLDDQEKLVLQDQGTVKNDEGTLHYNQVQLSYCHIVSPISGKVGLRLVDPGNVVQANSTTVLAVITQMDPITVIFTISEDSLGQVRDQMRRGARLSVEALDRAQQTKIATGTLTTTDNQIDTTTGTVKLRATFDNRDGKLFPNQFVNTRLLVNTQKGVTLIPTNAIQHNGQQAFVYVVDNGTAKIQQIKQGITDGNTTAVQGISPGDQVATSTFERLQNGSKVVIAKAPVPANTTESNTP